MPAATLCMELRAQVTKRPVRNRNPVVFRRCRKSFEDSSEMIKQRAFQLTEGFRTVRLFAREAKRVLRRVPGILGLQPAGRSRRRLYCLGGHSALARQLRSTIMYHPTPE